MARMCFVHGIGVYTWVRSGWTMRVKGGARGSDEVNIAEGARGWSVISNVRARLIRP